jgi:hypothetical protein
VADQSVALDVKAPAVNFDPASQLSAATNYQIGQSQLQMLNRQNAGQSIEFRNQLIRNAAAHALDSDSWDAAMSQAAQKGAPEAAQYVGRYTPLLQQRLFDAYGGSSPQAQGSPAGPANATAAGAAAPTDQMDRMYQNVTPAQMAQSLQKNNAILAALSTVKDEQSYNAAIAKLTAAGIPNATQIAGPYNPLNVVKLWNDTQQRVQYLQEKVAASSTGVAAENLVPVPWKVTNAKDSFGNERPIAYNPNNPAQAMQIKPSSGATAAATSPYDTFAKTMNGAENATGNPAATPPINPQTGQPASSAMGNGQFIDQTWLDTVKGARPDLVKGMTDKQILAMRADPQLSNEMTAEYARQNAQSLAADGLPVTSATLALAHRFGPDGAKTILAAPADAKLADILPKKVIDANPSLADQTAGQYAQGLVKQFGNTPLSAVKTPTLANFDPENVDPNLSGWDYAKQYPTEIQDAARAYMNGGTMPTGNPRNQGIATMAKMVAQKVAADLGRPDLADDTLYPQRRQMQVELAKTTSPQSVGGQITFGGTALGHLATYATDLAELHNVSGMLTPIGHGVNWLASLGPEQAGKINKATADAQHYGQEISKFYAGGPAGEAERNRFLGIADPTTKTPQELAGVVRGERDLIPERYAQIRANIENVLGPEAAAKALARLDVQGDMDKINRALARLDPTGMEAKALQNAPAPAATPQAAAPTVDPRDAAALRANSHNPAWAAAIDAKYGQGAAAKVLGQ